MNLKETLLSTEEVCEILRISKRTLQNYRDRKIITFVQFGRKILYQEADIYTFLQAHHIKTDALKGGQKC